jgi:hypothetical protein
MSQKDTLDLGFFWDNVFTTKLNDTTQHIYNVFSLISSVILVVVDFTPLISRIVGVFRESISNSPEAQNILGLVERPSCLHRISCRGDLMEQIRIGRVSDDDIEAHMSPGHAVVNLAVMPQEMAQHLFQNRKHLALGKKYSPGDKISNAQGMLSSIAMAVCCKTVAFYDALWIGSSVEKEFSYDKIREVIVSGTVQPDFELGGCSQVAMPVFELGDEAKVGERLSYEYLKEIPTPARLSSEGVREGYDNSLNKHMIWHLTQAHHLPAKNEVHSSKMAQEVLDLADQKIRNPGVGFENEFLQLANGKVLSLEALYNFYYMQLTNELQSLESFNRDYCYTIDPPNIFVRQFGDHRDKKVLNRLNLLALKQVLIDNPGLNHMKTIAFNGFADREAIAFGKDLFKEQFSSSPILFCEKSDIINMVTAEVERLPKGQILVLHNNSDAFGNNIENEEATSLDGVVGCATGAYLGLGVGVKVLGLGDPIVQQ